MSVIANQLVERNGETPSEALDQLAGAVRIQQKHRWVIVGKVHVVPGQPGTGHVARVTMEQDLGNWP